MSNIFKGDIVVSSELLRAILLGQPFEVTFRGGAAASLSSLSLSANSVAEDVAQGALVGSITGSKGGSTLSLLDTAGNRFALSGTNIVRGVTPLDFETATSHQITVRETNAGYDNSPRDTVITINVTNVIEGSGAPRTLDHVTAMGDSISIDYAGHYNNLTEVEMQTSHPGLTWVHEAVSGSTITGANPLDERIAAVIANGSSYVSIFIGANDLFGYASGDAFYATLVANVIQPLKEGIDGVKIAVATVLPRLISGNVVNAHNTNRPAANAAIRNGEGVDFDKVIDFAADATIGPDSAAADTGLYDAQGLHPLDGTHNTYMKPIYLAAMQDMLTGIGGNYVEAPVLGFEVGRTNGDPIYFDESPNSEIDFPGTSGSVAVGMYWHIQVASDAGFTTGINGEGSIRDNLGLQQIVADDFINGVTFPELVDQGTGTVYVRIRVERDDGAMSRWSNSLMETVSGLTPTQFDATNKFTHLEIVSSGLAVQDKAINQGATGGCRVDQARTGKRYFEFTVTQFTAQTWRVGVGQNDVMTWASDLNASPGHPTWPEGFSFKNDGNLIFNGNTNVVTSGIGAFAQGDIGMIAFDTATKEIWVGRNGTWETGKVPGTDAGRIISSAMADWYAFVSIFVTHTSQRTLTCNFGASAFAYSIPTGFEAYT